MPALDDRKGSSRDTQRGDKFDAIHDSDEVRGKFDKWAAPAELLQAIGRLGGEVAQAGVLVDTAGLMPAAAGARVRLEGGKISTSEGPIASGHEVIGAYAIFNVQSKQDAIEWASRELWAFRMRANKLGVHVIEYSTGPSTPSCKELTCL